MLYLVTPYIGSPRAGWGGSKSRVGYSDQVDPGDVDELAQSRRFAFDVTFSNGQRPPTIRTILAGGGDGKR